MMNERLFYPLLLAGGFFALATLFAALGYDATWRLWNIPTMTPHFADLRTITGGAESYMRGLDPMVNNPADPWGRAMSYPRIWQGLFLFNLDQSHVTWMGLGLILGFLVGLLVFVGRIGEGTALVLLLAIFSPAVLLALERANNDLVVFFLLALALLTWRIGWLKSSFGLIFVATLLKLFPLFVLAAFIRDPRPEVRRYLIFTLLAIAFYGVLSLDDLQLIRQLVPKGIYLSYGIDVLPSYLNASGSALGAAFKSYGLLAVGVMLLTFPWLSGRISDVPFRPREDLRLAMLFGTAVYLGSFLLGNNWDYRLMFLLFTIPLLSGGVSDAPPLLRRLARAMLWLLLLSLWSSFITRWLGSDGPWVGRYILLDETINWLLFALGMLLFSYFLRPPAPRIEEAPGGSLSGPQQLWRSNAHGLLLLVSLWAAVTWLNDQLRQADPSIDTPLYFPLSIFIPEFHLAGLHYIVLLLGLLYVALQYWRSLTPFQLWLVGVLALVAGNLAQGGFDRGFLQPFYLTGYQYYHDALIISDPWQWLRAFHQQQEQLLVHSRTHPPFAVLLHYLFLPAQGSSATLLALAFTLLGSLSVPLLWYSLRAADVTPDKARLGALLLAYIPAFNIYVAVSLDGVILTCSLLFLYGLLRLWQGRTDPLSLAAVTLGLLAMALLSFAASFSAAVLALALAWRYHHTRSRPLIWAGLGVFAAVGVAFLLLWWWADYNHLEALFTASRLENPQGFILFAHPLEYLLTRAEGILEVLLFFSLAAAVVLLQRLGQRQGGPAEVLMWIALAVWVAMLLTGAFRTGETARACLFVYPYLLLGLMGLEERRLEKLVVLAGIQTALMQSFGYYFW